MSSELELGKLVDDYAKFLLARNPVIATALGVHTEDGRLGDYDSSSIKGEIDELKSMKQRLLKILPSELALEKRIEFELLSSKIETSIVDLEEIKTLQKNPSFYPDVCLYGIFLLMSREFATPKERARSVVARLREIPKILSQAKENVENPPKIFVEIAQEVTIGGKEFLTEVSQFLESSTPGERSHWASALDEADEALRGYGMHLEKILPECRGEFALGEKWFNFKLEREYMVSHTCSSLEGVGRREFDETKKKMLELAREIDRSKTIEEIIAEIKEDHPEPETVKESYENEMLNAKGFVKEKGIASIPEGESLVCIDTPIFERNTIPYAAYLPPGPFEEKQQGLFYVTPVSSSMSKREQKERLRGHNMCAIITCSLHEAYPGHHLQLVWANRVVSKMRKLGDSNILAEGWALYCEEMMHEQGFYKDPKVRLYQLKDQLWRAARIIIDVGLHTGKMSIDEAVDFLVKEVWLEKPNAISEVRRYTMSPTQPSSYLLGKLEIMSLRDDYKKKTGSSFSLGTFHEALLGAGTIPPKLIRSELIES